MWSAHSTLANLVIILIAISVFIDVHILSSKGNLAERNYVVMTGFCALALGLILVLTNMLVGKIALGSLVDTRSFFPSLEEHKILVFLALLIIGMLTLIQGSFLWFQRELNHGRGWGFVSFVWLSFVVVLLAAYYGSHLVYIN
jgi:hypothetical protein